MNKCQNVKCNNEGKKVTVRLLMKHNSTLEVHDIYLCEICLQLHATKDCLDKLLEERGL